LARRTSCPATLVRYASLHLSLAGTLAFSTAFVLPHRSFIHCVGSGPFSVPA
jgi:hypothetical protein